MINEISKWLPPTGIGGKIKSRRRLTGMATAAQSRPSQIVTIKDKDGSANSRSRLYYCLASTVCAPPRSDKTCLQGNNLICN